MNPRVKNVTPLQEYQLKIVFEDGQHKLFDVKPYLNKGAFQELQDYQIFNSVRPFMGSIQWSNGLDLCPDTLYEDGITL